MFSTLVIYMQCIMHHAITTNVSLCTSKIDFSSNILISAHNECIVFAWQPFVYIYDVIYRNIKNHSQHSVCYLLSYWDIRFIVSKGEFPQTTVTKD